MSQDNKNNADAQKGGATKKDGGKGDGGKNDAAPAKKALTLTLSFSTVTTFCVVLLGCISMAFVMGVIVGRGDNPETHLPQIAALMPDDGNKDVVKEQVKDENSVTKPQVMPKEELDYSSLLKKRAEGEELKDEATPELVFTVPDAKTTEQASAPQPATTAPVVEEVPAKAPEPEIFDYIFQVATFTDEASVDRLREKLEGNGLRTKMEKTGKFYKVLVLMRGNAEQAQTLRKLMVDIKLGEPLQRGKKAVQ